MDFLMMGELFQNNHHKSPNDANFAKKWFELDPTYYVIRFLHSVRIIKLRKMPLGERVTKLRPVRREPEVVEES